ncbi:MAG: DNA polymerase [Nitrososphaera sp.]
MKIDGPGAVYGRSHLIGVALGDLQHQEYIPIGHEGATNTPKEEAIEIINKFLASGSPIVGAKILYDLEQLAVFGCKIPEKATFLDVQYAEALLEEDGTYNLEYLAQKYGSTKTTTSLEESYADMFNVPLAKVNRDQVYKVLAILPLKIVSDYAKQDVKATLEVLDKQLPLIQNQGLRNLFDMECSLIYVLHRMRMQSIDIDLGKLNELYRIAYSGIATIESKYSQLLSLRSANCLGSFLLENGIQVPINHNTKSSCRYLITRQWLKEFNGHDTTGIIKDVLEYRELLKLKNTFLDSYLLKRIQKDNENIYPRIHPLFHPLKGDQYGTVAGRFSSSNPNLQNIPMAGKQPIGQVRNIFVPKKEEEWVKIDRSQIEYRLLVNYASGQGADAARRAYVRDPNTDFHKFVMGLTGLDRKSAKVCNFLLVYGGSVAKLIKISGLDPIKCEGIYNTYHEKLGFVRATYKIFQSRAFMNEEIRTLTGRRRKFSNGNQYKALNAFIQGTAADIMKIDMYSLWTFGLYDEIGYPLLTVHDELDFSVPINKLKILKEAKSILENIYKKYTADIKVPLLVNFSKGPNWGQQEDIKV